MNKNKYLANKLKWGNKFKANTGRVIKSLEYILINEIKSKEDPLVLLAGNSIIYGNKAIKIQ